MANNFQKIKNGLNLQPQITPPANLNDGDIYHDSTLGLMVRTAGSTVPAGGGRMSGEIIMWPGTTEPLGWVFCYGQAISRTTFAALFAVCSTTYGPGDGTTTFNLPDLRGRVPAGRDDMGGVTASRLTAAIAGITGTTLGATGGNQAMHGHTHAATGLTVSGTNSSSAITGTTAAHSHELVYPGSLGGNRRVYGDYVAGGTGNNIFLPPAPVSATAFSNPAFAETNTGLAVTGTTAAQIWSGTVAGSTSSFGAGASQNVQPTIILNFIIKT